MYYLLIILSTFSENLDIFNNLIGICTPIIVFAWFMHSYRETLESKYYNELVGSYGGFFTGTKASIRGGILQGGCILEIRSIDANGYFIGDFRRAELETLNGGHRIEELFRSEGVDTYVGRLNYHLKISRTIHPYKPKENRIYKGKLWLTRLDFNVINQDVDEFTTGEFNIIHFRESRVMVLEVVRQPEYFGLPDRIQLHKTTGNSFDAYNNVMFHFKRVGKLQDRR